MYTWVMCVNDSGTDSSLSHEPEKFESTGLGLLVYLLHSMNDHVGPSFRQCEWQEAEKG